MTIINNEIQDLEKQKRQIEERISQLRIKETLDKNKDMEMCVGKYYIKKIEDYNYGDDVEVSYSVYKVLEVKAGLYGAIQLRIDRVIFENCSMHSYLELVDYSYIKTSKEISKDRYESIIEFSFQEDGLAKLIEKNQYDAYYCVETYYHGKN